MPVADGHRYGCWTDCKPRGGKNVAMLNTRTAVNIADTGIGDQMQIVQIKEPVATDWAYIVCGHNLRATDPSCDGCINQGMGTD